MNSRFVLKSLLFASFLALGFSTAATAQSKKKYLCEKEVKGKIKELKKVKTKKSCAKKGGMWVKADHDHDHGHGGHDHSHGEDGHDHAH